MRYIEESGGGVESLTLYLTKLCQLGLESGGRRQKAEEDTCEAGVREIRSRVQPQSSPVQSSPTAVVGMSLPLFQIV